MSISKIRNYLLLCSVFPRPALRATLSHWERGELIRPSAEAYGRDYED